jgi:CheY-like chemotaxis protein
MASAHAAGTRLTPSIALVVNDDRDTSEVYEHLLSGDGLWVTSCPEREAIEYARDVQPDVILSDVDVRPGAPSRDILHHFHEDAGLRELPVLLIASCPPDGWTVQQVDTILVKPVEPTRLLEAVHEVLDRSRMMRKRSGTLRQSVSAVLLRSQKAVAARSEPLLNAAPMSSKPGSEVV